MKKIVIMSGIVAMTLLASCKDKKEEVPPPPQPVENPAPPATPEPTVNTTVENEEKDGTSVRINGDGVSVQNKNGDNESNVTISGDKKEVEIRRD